ncbi:MAG: hypothetical protein U5L96_20505 [Owenweeksia sp.]|nr:hypothetical protein [Owenweeksia sp.]
MYQVKAVISQKPERHYDEESGYAENRYLQLQARNEHGNTKWYLSTESSFYMHHYNYFDGKVALYRYPLLKTGGSENHYDQKPYWYETVKMGLCEENGLCIKVDEKGRPAVSFKDYYAYDGEKLVQILGDREASTLFYYDESGRLSEILSIGSNQQTITLFYNAGASLPYHVEHRSPNQSHPQNFYQIIHRK